MNRLRILQPLSFCLLLLAGISPLWGQIHFTEEQIHSKLRDPLRKGDYERVVENGHQLARFPLDPESKVLITDYYAAALLAVGKTEEAQKAVAEALEELPDDLPLLLLAAQISKQRGHDPLPRLQELNRSAGAKPLRDRSPRELVALGEAADLLGADPNKVLGAYFEPAKKAAPELRDAWLAAGELMLRKHDNAKAGKNFTAALREFPDDADLLLGLAEAILAVDREKGFELLAAALEQNPNHTGALLRRAAFYLDAETYPAAHMDLEAALAVDPGLPAAHALTAALAQLQGQEELYTLSRERALKRNPNNAEVDHLIGKALSRMRRFAAGIAHQRRALELDPEFTEARLELAMDLLRTGDEEAAWEAVEEVRALDSYSVLAYNLTLLRKQIAKFETLREGSIILKMSPQEARIYGDRALALLRDAHDVLCEKYGLTLEQTTLIEFFPREQDFAIRTFGVPMGGGVLGACFGSVVTMNSPGGTGAGRNNWESTLWHEFAHVVTLTATDNKMPRWLSEGISVYEEEQRNPAWGMPLSPAYRERILSEDGLVPIAGIGQMFLDGDTMFAYFESYLTVSYLAETFGEDSLRKILDSIREGSTTEEALAEHCAPMATLEKGFAKFARNRAENLAPGLDFTPPAANTKKALTQLLSSRPNNFYGLIDKAKRAFANGDPAAALEPARQLRTLFPDYIGENNGYLLLAQAARKLEDAATEEEALAELSKRSPNALKTYQRLMEVGEKRGDWDLVGINAQRHLAVHPLLPRTHYFAARALEEEGLQEEALAGYKRWLELGAANPGDAHFRIARLLQNQDPDSARRHVLDAIAEAPRRRDAHQLLLELTDSDPHPEPEVALEPEADLTPLTKQTMEPSPEPSEAAKPTPPPALQP